MTSRTPEFETYRSMTDEEREAVRLNAAVLHLEDALREAQEQNSLKLLVKAESCVGIVVVAHGGLAEEYVSAMAHVVGSRNGIIGVSVTNSRARSETEQRISEAANAVDTGNGVVIVVDVFGGTSVNFALPAAGPSQRRILSDANLPTLVALAKHRNADLDVALEAAMLAGRRYLDGSPGERNAQKKASHINPSEEVPSDQKD